MRNRVNREIKVRLSATFWQAAVFCAAATFGLTHIPPASAAPPRGTPSMISPGMIDLLFDFEAVQIQDPHYGFKHVIQSCGAKSRSALPDELEAHCRIHTWWSHSEEKKRDCVQRRSDWTICQVASEASHEKLLYFNNHQFIGGACGYAIDKLREVPGNIIQDGLGGNPHPTATPAERIKLRKALMDFQSQCMTPARRARAAAEREAAKYEAEHPPLSINNTDENTGKQPIPESPGQSTRHPLHQGSAPSAH